MSKLLAVLTFTVAYLASTPIGGAAAVPSHYHIFISAAGSEAVRKAAFELVRQTYYEVLQPGETLTVYTADRPEEITRVTLPTEANPNLRTKSKFDAHAKFSGMVRDHLKGLVPKFEDGNLDIPSVARFFADRVAVKRGEQHVLVLIGSPFHKERADSRCDMTDYYPNDDFLFEQTPYSTHWATDRRPLDRIPVHHIFPTEDFRNAYHRDRVERFWSLHWQLLGASLKSFTTDVKAYRSFAQHEVGSATVTPVREDKLVMHSVEPFGEPIIIRQPTRQVGLQTKLDTPPISRIKINLRWSDATDLDLYVRYRDAEVFHAKRTAEFASAQLQFWQDVYAPGVANRFGWEYVEILGEHLDPEACVIRINVYEAAVEPLAVVPFELHVVVGDRSYRWKADIPGQIGTRGQKPASGAWRTFRLSELLSQP